MIIHPDFTPLDFAVTVSPLRAWVITLMANFNLSEYEALCLAMPLMGKTGYRLDTITFEQEKK